MNVMRRIIRVLVVMIIEDFYRVDEDSYIKKMAIFVAGNHNIDLQDYRHQPR